MILISIFMLLLTACTNILIPDIQNYRSVHLNGNGWIQIPNQNYNCTNDLRVLDDNFTFEVYFSGDNKNTNSAGTIFSLTGKQTENFRDTNCNGELDEDEIDNDGNGTLDIEVNDDFVVLAVQNDPTVNNLLSFYVNDIENEVLFEGKNFNSKDQFHLLQITSNGDSIFFYIDRDEILSLEADIMIQGADLLIGARGNQYSVSNPWNGYIDEVRLWNEILTNEIMDMHFESSDKLINTMQDSSLCNLVGLWTFNYEDEKIEINDEKCNEAGNLYYNICEFDICEYPLNATLYTFPGLEVKYSRKGF
ncbi:MAG: hypothetical protein CMG05_02060 [Candidatus Marinimicrobia bacterium]|nr:hypothetical protein [Candidatus Neomarinimicrobiota bacterium]|tara:strand:- start:6694 stop:7611 length:918 start_codon:yes stop_codon:yes gene_type:complete